MTVTQWFASVIREWREKIDAWNEAHSYLRFVDNWHKWSPLARCLCKIGRHDFEFYHLRNEDVATLECFYCGRRRNSHKLIETSLLRGRRKLL